MKAYFYFCTIPCTLQCSVLSLSHVRLFVTPWTAERQASLSITNSWGLPKLMSIGSVMPSNHLILCLPLLLLPSIFPTSRSFQMSQLFTSGGQNIGVFSFNNQFPMNSQDWFPVGWTGWISLVTLQCGWAISSNNALNNKQFLSCFIMPFWQTVYIKPQIAVGMLEAVYSVCLVNLCSWFHFSIGNLG